MRAAASPHPPFGIGFAYVDGMGDACSKISIAHFNRHHPENPIVEDDGDGFPSVFDKVGGNKKLNFEKNLNNYYGKFCPQGWMRQLGRLRDYLPPEAFELLSGTRGMGSFPSAGYFLASYFSYQNNPVQTSLLEFLRWSPVPAETLLEMVRSAKARGDVELGKAIHQIFEIRLLFSDSKDNFLRLPFRDDWDDPIFLLRTGASARAWHFAQRGKLSEQELREWAATLAYYVSLEIPPNSKPNDFKKIILQTRAFYSAGLPLPPHLRIFHAKDGPSGHYESRRDVLSLRSDWDEANWAHEWGHFLMDLMDDDGGPNATSFEYAMGPGGYLFDPTRCLTWESVSLYAGICDAERGERGSFVRSGRKAHEDPAETISYLWEERRGQFLWSTALLNLYEIRFKDKLSWLITLILAIGEAEIPSETLEDFSAHAAEFHRLLGRDAEAPPRFFIRSRASKKQYVEKLYSWYERITTRTLPEAKQVRAEKIRWARDLLNEFNPKEGSPSAPDPKIKPWKLGRD